MVGRLNDHSVPLSSHRHIRSAERNLLHAPRGHRLSMYGRSWAFAIARTSAWNGLPVPGPVCNPSATETAFRRLLNTFLVRTVLVHWGGPLMMRYGDPRTDNVDCKVSRSVEIGSG